MIGTPRARARWPWGGRGRRDQGLDGARARRGGRGRGDPRWACAHACGSSFPLGSRNLRLLLSVSKRIFPIRPAFQICEIFQGVFPKPGLGESAGLLVSGEAAAVASDAWRLAASTAGLVKVRAISGTLPTGSSPELPSGQRPQVDYLVAPFFVV